jgi:predicted Zn-dependent protease
MPPDTRSLNAAIGYFQLGMIDDALEQLESLPPEQRGNEQVVELRIEIYRHLEKWESARIDAEAMAKRNPGNAGWWISWAYSLRREKSVEEAREVLWEALRLHPNELMISYNLACYASVLGELDEARRLLDRVFSEDARYRPMAAEDPDLASIFRE